jgi:ssDNA-binding Zn-finger/Zn-ribbon topoisomerase 1
MVAQCMDCRSDAGLHNKQCLTGILNGLAQEFNVDSVILSHYIETKYADESMRVLRMMVEFFQNLDQMAIRDPYNEYFADNEELSSSTRNQQKGKCEKCAVKPEAIFSSLKKDFLKDVSKIYYTFNNFTEKVAANREETCERCMRATKSDMVYLFNRLENFRAYVIYKGFQIVI